MAGQEKGRPCDWCGQRPPADAGAALSSARRWLCAECLKKPGARVCYNLREGMNDSWILHLDLLRSRAQAGLPLFPPPQPGETPDPPTAREPGKRGEVRRGPSAGRRTDPSPERHRPSPTERRRRQRERKDRHDTP